MFYKFFLYFQVTFFRLTKRLYPVCYFCLFLQCNLLWLTLLFVVSTQNISDEKKLIVFSEQSHENLFSSFSWLSQIVQKNKSENSQKYIPLIKYVIGSNPTLSISHAVATFKHLPEDRVKFKIEKNIKFLVLFVAAKKCFFFVHSPKWLFTLVLLFLTPNLMWGQGSPRKTIQTVNHTKVNWSLL